MHLKSDSFAVESNVHFPTDYNLLWDCARKYLNTINSLLEKYDTAEQWRKIHNWRYEVQNISLIITLEHFSVLMNKHIDLVDRRILKGETIPHEEKMFSVFETYTEWGRLS